MTNEINLLDVLLQAAEDVKGSVHIERLGMDVELKALHVTDVQALRAKCSYPGDNGKLTLNAEEFNEELVNAAVVGPKELFDAKLLKHHKAKHTSDLLNTILLIGEMQLIMQATQELNGVSKQSVDAAKN